MDYLGVARKIHLASTLTHARMNVPFKHPIGPWLT